MLFFIFNCCIIQFILIFVFWSPNLSLLLFTILIGFLALLINITCINLTLAFFRLWLFLNHLKLVLALLLRSEIVLNEDLMRRYIIWVIVKDQNFLWWHGWLWFEIRGRRILMMRMGSDFGSRGGVLRDRRMGLEEESRRKVWFFMLYRWVATVIIHNRDYYWFRTLSGGWSQIYIYIFPIILFIHLYN